MGEKFKSSVEVQLHRSFNPRSHNLFSKVQDFSKLRLGQVSSDGPDFSIFNQIFLHFPIKFHLPYFNQIYATYSKEFSQLFQNSVGIFFAESLFNLDEYISSHIGSARSYFGTAYIWNDVTHRQTNTHRAIQIYNNLFLFGG